MKRMHIIVSLILILLFTGCAKQTIMTWQEQYDLGIRYLNEGNYEEAIIAFTAAIEIDQKNVDAYLGRAEAYMNSNDANGITNALADYTAVIEIDTTCEAAYVGMANAYIKQGDYDKAKEVLDKVSDESLKLDLLTEIEKSIAESLELSEIQLENISYTFSVDEGIIEVNEGAVGGMCISANVLSPSNAKTVLIATWGQDISEWSQSRIKEQALRYAKIWKDANVHVQQERTIPYEIGVSHPVDEDELGTHNEVLLIGLDENYNPVGYAIVSGDIPRKSNVNEEMQKYKGVYYADNRDVSLSVFDINAKNELFIEIGLKDTWVVVGTAYLDGNCAEFSIDGPYDNSPGANAGTITFEENSILLDIVSTQVNFENNIGSYVLTKGSDIKLGSTYSDNRIRLQNHTIFNDFVEKAFANTQVEWQYLGQTSGEFNNLSYEDGLNADLYRLEVDDFVRYYSVDLADLMDERECGVREIIDGVLSPYLFLMDLTGSSYFTPESESY